jgi:TonB-linked SusC/RagA family outer membrane protein
MAGPSYGQNTKITLNMKDASIEQILNKIEDESGFYFLFNQKLIDVSRKVDINSEEKPIKDILGEILGKDVNVIVYERQIILTPRQLSFELSQPQQQNIVSGTITDAATGSLMPGVNISVKGTTIGAISDANGKYSLTITDKNAILVISFIGYSTQEISIAGKTNIDVILKAETKQLEEVVVVGYGTQRKVDFTGSLQVVKLKDIQTVPTSTFLESLQGVVPGLNVQMSNSVPGASPDMLIRGDRSLSANNDPLIILDGFPYQGSINEISPNDIESISILKDISSSAIYGARAANGVILITTKKGSTGKIKVTYSGSFGVEEPEHLIKMMDGKGYMKKLEDVASYINWSYTKPEDLLFAAQIPSYESGAEINWLDLVFRTGLKSDQNISFSGGNEKTTYYTSLGALNELGIVKYSSFKRYNLRSNISHNFSKWLKYNSNIQLTSNNPGGFTPSLTEAIKMAPYAQLKQSNGTYALYPEYPEVYDTSPFADYGATKNELSENIFIKQNLVVSPTFVPGLSYDLSAGLTLLNYNYGSYYPSTTVDGLTSSGVANISNIANRDLIFEHLLTYKKSFGKNNLELTGLYSREQSRERGSAISASGFVNDIVEYNDVQAAQISQQPSSYLTEKAIESLMGRLNYNYNNLYYLTLTYRRDGYSGFGVNKKYGAFPSIAFGYILTNQSFLKDKPLLNYLKLRVSYGSAGNMAINPYQTLDQYQTVQYIYGDVSSFTNGFTTSVVGNSNLGWETTTSLNLGLDFTILKSKLSGTVDLFSSKSTDLLMNRQVPIMNGYQTIWDNIGETSGKGIEVSLNSINIESKDFKWTSNLNFYMQRDKIVKLRGDNTNDIANNWFIGEPLKVYYDLNNIGIFQSQAQVQQLNATAYGKPGLYIIEDVNKDGVISLDDRKIIGKVNPGWTMGLSNYIHYKKFDFSLQLYAVMDWIKPNSLVNPGAYLSEKQTNYPAINYWTPDNPTAPYLNPGADKVLVWGGADYMNSSYLRIQNISASYSLGSIKILGIEDAKITFNVKNAYTFTKWLGFDPEASNTFAPYPDQRVYTLGININF